MEFQKVFDSVPIHELLQTIQKKARSGSKEIGNYIRGILQGCADNSDTSEKYRFETFKSSLSILQTPDISYNLVSEIVSILLLKVESFHTSNLVKLADFFIEYSNNASNFTVKWLEVFAKLLSCLPHRDSIVYQGSDMSGKEMRKNILYSLFSENINIPFMIQLVSVLKDIDLSEEEVKLVSEKLLKALPEVELNDLPSFVYQLLLFSSKGQRHLILLNVASYFIKKDNALWNIPDEDGNSEDLICNDEETLFRQTEGTVILMISVSARHDQALSKEYCSMLKKMQYNPEIILSPFAFACALSLSKSISGKDEIFDVLKKSLTLACQFKDKKKNSLWMREMVPKNPDVLKLIEKVIKCSRFGWDHVCQGLVKFGFSVIEAFGPRYILGGNAVKTVSEEGCAIGNHILRDTFKNHRLVRSEILEEILNRIITKSQKPVKHYIDILSQIAKSDPLFLLEILPKIVEILDFIHLVPHANAVDIFLALAPLLRISMPLKDTLMLVLRKALFHRDMGARKVAVSGYLIILKKLAFIGRISLSQSQTSFSSQASSASLISTQVKADVYVSAGNPSSQTMCLEIMGLLKRVLMQQGVVRQLLYEGLYDCILQNKSLKDIVLELLLGQLEKYYIISENSSLPLQFELCFKEQKNLVTIEEPLADLLTIVHLILHEAGDASEDEDYDQSAQKMLEDIFQNLFKRLTKIEVLDLNLNSKESEESSTDSIKLKLILNCYESMLEYSFISNQGFHKEQYEEFLELYEKYKEIYSSQISKKQKKSSKIRSTNVPSMLVTIRFFAKVLEALFADVTFKHQEGLNILRKNSAFVFHIISSCNQVLAKLAENGVIDGFSGSLKNPFQYILSIAKTYYNTYMKGLLSDFPSSNFPTLELEKLPFFFAEGLVSVFTYVTAFMPKKASSFILDLYNQDSLATDQVLKLLLKSIQKSIFKLLSDTENDIGMKEIVPLLSIIKILYNQFTDKFSDDIYKWMKQLCAQHTFQNVSISKSIVSLCLTLGHQQPNFLAFFREIAFDIHHHMDDIDPDHSVSGVPKYNIITSEVASFIVPNLTANLEICLDEIECMLNYIKENSSLPLELNVINDKDISKQTIEQGICTQLSDMIFVLHELVQTGVPPDSLANNILKLVARFYKVLSTVIKYYLLLHKCSKTIQLPSAFEKLVKLSHTKLTTFVYGFVTYIQVVSGGTTGGKKKSNNDATSKAMREIKTIPTLIFAIESYEKDLILLSKKYNKNLVNHMKLSTARDFRINAAAITSVLDQQAEDESSVSPSLSRRDEIADGSEVTAEAVQEQEENIEEPIHADSSNHEHIDEDVGETHKTNGTLVLEKENKDSSNNKLNLSKCNKVPTVKRKRLGARVSSKRVKISD